MSSAALSFLWVCRSRIHPCGTRNPVETFSSLNTLDSSQWWRFPSLRCTAGRCWRLLPGELFNACWLGSAFSIRIQTPYSHAITRAHTRTHTGTHKEKIYDIYIYIYLLLYIHKSYIYDRQKMYITTYVHTYRHTYMHACIHTYTAFTYTVYIVITFSGMFAVDSCLICTTLTTWTESIGATGRY